MGIFGRKREPAIEPSRQPRQTINGNPNIDPEVVGGRSTRRTRFFGEATRRIAAHPLAAPSAAGTPIGDGAGMEELVALVQPAFKQDRDLLRWCALRGALAFVHAYYLKYDPAGGQMRLLRTMGFDLQPDGDGAVRPVPWEPPGCQPLSPQTRENILGLFFALDQRLNAYPRFEDMPADGLLADPLFMVSTNVALDFIAWAAVAAVRDQVAPIQALPEPAGFDGAGLVHRANLRQG